MARASSEVPLHEEVWLPITATTISTSHKSLRPSQASLPETDAVLKFATLRANEGLWQIQLFSKAAHKFQKWHWQKSFSTYAKAKAYLQSIEFASISPGNYESFSSQNLIISSEGSSEISSQVASEVNGAVLWQDTETWSWQWEMAYAEWVKTNLKKDFFVQINLKTDCADLALAVRWIFARIHGLPAANTLAGSGQLFTNRSMQSDWLNLPTHTEWKKDQRFFAALDYLLDNTYTHTLFKDSYPIEMTSQAFLAGTHHLSLSGASGHTQLANRVNEKFDIPIRTLASGAPRAVHELYEGIFFSAEQPKKNASGFLKMRWPVYSASQKVQLLNKNKMPYFSEEQYSDEFIKNEKNFSLAVYKRLNPDFSFANLVKETLAEIKSRVLARMQVVRDGYDFCSKNDCKEGTSGYEAWSTPARDKRIVTMYSELAQVIYQLNHNSDYYLQASTAWKTEANKPLLNLFEKNYTLYQIMYSWEAQGHNINPWEPEETRWGLAPNIFLNNSTKNMAELLMQRQAKISDPQNPCAIAEQCPEDSDHWLNWNTFEIDQKITVLASRLRRYCNFYTELNCADWQSKINSKKINGKSLQHWLSVAVWLNSDPRVSTEVKWGANKPANLIEVEQIGQYTIDKKNNFLMINASANTFEAQLYRLVNHSAVTVPAGYTWGGLQENTSLLFSYKIENQQIEINFKNETLDNIYAYHTAKIADTPLFMHWANAAGIFVLIQGSQLSIIDVLNKKNYQYIYVSDSTDQYTYLAQNLGAKAGEYLVLDFNSEWPFELAIQLPLAEIKNKKIHLLNVIRSKTQPGTQSSTQPLILSTRLICDKNLTAASCPDISNFTYSQKGGSPLVWHSAADQHQAAREIVRFFEGGAYALTRYLKSATLYTYEFSKVNSLGRLELIKILPDGTAHYIGDHSPDYFSVFYSDLFTYKEFYFHFTPSGQLQEYKFAANEVSYNGCYFDLCSIVQANEPFSLIKNMKTSQILYKRNSPDNIMLPVIKKENSLIQYINVFSVKYPALFRLNMQSAPVLENLPFITNSNEVFSFDKFQYPFSDYGIKGDAIYSIRKGQPFERGLAVQYYMPYSIAAPSHLNQTKNIGFLILD